MGAHQPYADRGRGIRRTLLAQAGGTRRTPDQIRRGDHASAPRPSWRRADGRPNRSRRAGRRYPRRSEPCVAPFAQPPGQEPPLSRAGAPVRSRRHLSGSHPATGPTGRRAGLRPDLLRGVPVDLGPPQLPARLPVRGGGRPGCSPACSPIPGFYSVVAELDGRVVGSNFLDERSAIAGVGPITVDPSVQDRGIGRRLMQAVLDRAAARRFAGVRLVQAAYHSRSLRPVRQAGVPGPSAAGMHAGPRDPGRRSPAGRCAGLGRPTWRA